MRGVAWLLRAGALACAALSAGCGDSTLPPSVRPEPSAWAVDAGALKLRVDENPWRLRFFDAEGNALLNEAAASSAALGGLAVFPGPPSAGAGAAPLLPPVVLGTPAAPVAREQGWTAAMRLVAERRDGDVWIGSVATANPELSLEVRAFAQADGVIAIEVLPDTSLGIQAMRVGFEAAPGEGFFGFGQRSQAVNQAGEVLEHYVGEGPYQDEEYPFITAVVPKWGIRWRRDASYYPIPWLLSSRGYGVLLDHDELSYHRLDATVWSAEVEAAALRFRVFAGPTPAEALRRYTEATGRQPDTLAPWAFGPWVQAQGGNLDARSVEQITRFVAADVPTSVTAGYTHYLPCGDQRGVEDQQRQHVRALNALGTAVHAYFNPMLCADYQPVFDQAIEQGVLIRDRLGQTYRYPYTTSTVFEVSQFDFTAPGTVAFVRRLLDEAIGHGYEGWMEDFGEYTPLDAVDRNGVTGTAFHNRYPRDYHCGFAAATAHHRKPLARFVRSGWTGSAACSPIVWGGDPSTVFGFDGLESSIYQALSMGLSGVGIWGSDIGGFFALGFTRRTPELLDRWIAFGAFSVIFRNQAGGIVIPDKDQPEIWDEPHLPIWRRYAKLRTQLYPYVRAAVDTYYRTGLPVMRHHVLTHPQDPQAIALDDQYLFGPDLLVAPVYQAGATERRLYLPHGRWVNFWDAVIYEEPTGAFRLREGTIPIVEGGQWVTVPAPREQIPLFVRAGARIPVLPPDVQTLADHGGPDIVRLRDRENQIRELHFPS
ncbi:Alpha-glucosidase, glycosyl hydrolase family GH31 [Fontimonas thermophila]|uniref:Alpha-glucosidase, glycosyl hydrolase family GH31 n=1 Tax=Fontimonas thermophila TaxID=1076937 RepID=A0A1I2HAL8_9GAMM|nr:TIM-barrel domain-containing protein [Fontimonas thermophila]SFF27224.1 Alpha-glucosidase, glycosyl hydrolase family GH31 [Fontimonas thermophila]